MNGLKEILESGKAPGLSLGTAVDQDTVFAKAPKGLKAIENEPKWKHGPTRSSQDIAKHFGMSRDFIKHTWDRPLVKKAVASILCVCGALQAMGGDLTRGTTLQDGQVVHASQLHQLVDNGSINTTFYSGQTLSTAGLLSDTMIVLQGGVFYREPISTMLFPIIRDQTPGIPGTNDLFLYYSVANMSLNSARLDNVLSNLNFAVFTTSTNAVNQALPIKTNWVLTLTQGSWNGTNNTGGSNELRTVQSVFEEGLASSYPTNLAAVSSISNTDNLLAWTSGDGTNWTAKSITKSNLLFSVAFLSTTNINLPYLYGTAGTLYNAPHNLGVTPSYLQWVLVNVTAEGGFVVGDEIPIMAIDQVVTNGAYDRISVFVESRSSTNFALNWLDFTPGVASPPRYLGKNGVQTTLSTNNWKAKAYYHP